MADTSGMPSPSPAGGAPSRNPLSLMRNLRLVVRLPLLVTSVAALAVCVIAATGYMDARAMLWDQVSMQQRQLLQVSSNTLRTEFGDMMRTVQAQARTPTIQAAAQSFTLAWEAIDTTPSEALRDEYVMKNSNPKALRDELVSTRSGSQYDLVHAKYHPTLRSLKQSLGLQDIYLVGRDGRVLYSVMKDEAFASDLGDGPLAGTPLSDAARGAPDGAVFADFGAGGDHDNAGFTAPVTGRDGQPLGTLVFVLPTTWIDSLLGELPDLGPHSSIFVIGKDMRLRSDSHLGNGLDVLAPVSGMAGLQTAFGGGRIDEAAMPGLEGNDSILSAISLTLGTSDWAVVVQQDEAQLMQPILSLRNTLLVQLGGLMAGVALMAWLVGRSIAAPFTAIGMRLNGLSQGDYDSAIPFVQRREDVGDLARNLENLRNRLSQAETDRSQRDRAAAEQQVVVDRLSAGIAELAAGNLTAEIAAPFAPDYEGLRRGFNNALTRLNETITSLVDASGEIDSNAREVENASNDLSQKAIEQAASLEETAAAITQLSASVKSTADSASDADRVMTRAREDAETSGTVVQRAITAMDQISTSSQKITQVTSVIEDLAFQTNLLALNAGVEAARAGEAGRGFAVVASEVRALAQRSSEAAKEINTLIHESAENVVNGVDLVDKAGKSFENLISDFEKVSASVSSIAAAAREQSVGLEEINSAVDQLDGVTQKNAAVATQVHGTGKVMVNEAAKLNQIAASFRISGGGRRPAVRDAHRPAPAQARQVVNAPVTHAPVADDSWAEF